MITKRVIYKYADFESVLQPETNNKKEILNKSYTKNTQIILLAVMAVN